MYEILQLKKENENIKLLKNQKTKFDNSVL